MIRLTEAFVFALGPVTDQSGSVLRINLHGAQETTSGPRDTFDAPHAGDRLPCAP